MMLFKNAARMSSCSRSCHAGLRPTRPVGKYNPDWAILKEGDQTLYLVRETKGTTDFLKLRTSEADKVRCGQRHFEGP
jgi:restriction endonuclease